MASSANSILEAVHLASSAEIPALRQLVAQGTLQQEHLLRILLTYLPEGTDPELYVDLLRDISVRKPAESYTLPSNEHLSTEEKLSDHDARQRVRRLGLTPLANAQFPVDPTTDPLTLFLIHQAHKIDAETGSLTLVSQLLGPFVAHSEILRTWMISNLLPLLRLDFEFYPHSDTPLSLAEFTRLEGRTAVRSLLSKAAQNNTQEDKVEIGRDLRGLIGPWMYGESSRKRRRLYQGRTRADSSAKPDPREHCEVPGEESQSSDWSFVNESILDLGTRDFPRAVDAIVQWSGPSDVDYGDWGNGRPLEDKERISACVERYAQTALAIHYSTNAASLETIMGSHRVLLQVIERSRMEEPPDIKRSDALINSRISRAYLESLSPGHLLHNALLLPQNPLTSPSIESISLINIILASCYKLLNLGCSQSAKDVAGLIMFSPEADQMALLRRILNKLKSEKMEGQVWASIRRQLIWLHDWEDCLGQAIQKPRGVFSRIPLANIEKEILRGMLDGTCYTLVADIYCKQNDAPLQAKVVEDTIVVSALSSYDAASDRNKTRGGVRRASDITNTFRSYFPESERFSKLAALLSATHALSFYSLKLQHGVALQPVNIRAHRDPMLLIEKLLDQNPRSYTHLDDLLEIGQNLVIAGLADQNQNGSADEMSMKHKTTIARRRIIRMTIEAALAEDDFDTAYSYVINRLSLTSQPKLDDESPDPTAASYDDISWRAAYAAGRYPENNSGSSALRRLEQRMELLSQALLLAPPSSLSEVLVVWQRCERVLTERISQETVEDEQWGKPGHHNVPGDFSSDSGRIAQKPRDSLRGSIQEEAPMGLFDVARGAAAALSKNAFPLRGPQKSGTASQPQSRPLSEDSVDDSNDGSIGNDDGSGRVRKRDVVSNMVTGGLASGIGWVIGESRTI